MKDEYLEGIMRREDPVPIPGAPTQGQQTYEYRLWAWKIRGFSALIHMLYDYEKDVKFVPKSIIGQLDVIIKSLAAFKQNAQVKDDTK